MMGYGQPGQVTRGVHQRLKARAFVFAERSEDSGRRAGKVAMVNVDSCMVGDAIKRRVLERVRALGLTDDTLVISATHTHSGPGGYLEHVLYQITTLGLVDDSVRAIEDGIVEALQAAYAALRPARVFVTKGRVDGGSVNRSPTAYENNPAEERARYEGNVDTEMVQLNLFEDDRTSYHGEDTKPFGILNWFPVHLTSVNSSNDLISPDNKGYAAYRLEREMRGKSPFVAGFAQSNMGDVSPNIFGARCVDTGEPCDMVTSACRGNNQLCRAFGPGWNISVLEPARLNGEVQFQTALRLLRKDRGKEVMGAVESRLMYVDMSNRTVVVDGKVKRTCLPAMGYSFGAGTTDGPGAMPFLQSDNSTSPHPFWNVVRGFVVKEPSAEQQACHYPKPILIDSGEATGPYLWQPRVVQTMIVRIGNVVVAAVPAEFSTMAGRRLKNRILDTLKKYGDPFGDDVTVVVMGPANSYSSYVTTPEEYKVQRYEGASTIFGPYTLNAYLDVYEELLSSLITGKALSKGDPPEDLTAGAIRMLPAPIADAVPPGIKFGAVRDNVGSTHLTVGDVVRVSFWAGHPRNGVDGGTFLAVERRNENGTWKRVRDDNDWDTRFSWKPLSKFTGISVATVEWIIGSDVEDMAKISDEWNSGNCTIYGQWMAILTGLRELASFQQVVPFAFAAWVIAFFIVLLEIPIVTQCCSCFGERTSSMLKFFENTIFRTVLYLVFAGIIWLSLMMNVTSLIIGAIGLTITMIFYGIAAAQNQELQRSFYTGGTGIQSRAAGATAKAAGGGNKFLGKIGLGGIGKSAKANMSSV
ncbi:hypothetical protein HDU96_001261 [Phlyctochytrium bullatum]|nr:hypothetical protein HDU96_001261 [Phlyctochytrium bullatum]